MRVGYCRPPAGHGPNKQREALEAAGCELVVDSGIASLLGSVDAGDVVVVASLGALGSTSASAVRAALEIGAKAAELVVLDQGIDTSKEEHGAFFRHAAAIMGVDEGRKGPRAKPGHSGGKSKVDPSALANAIGMYQSGDYKLSEITSATGISRSRQNTSVTMTNSVRMERPMRFARYFSISVRTPLSFVVPPRTVDLNSG